MSATPDWNWLDEAEAELSSGTVSVTSDFDTAGTMAVASGASASGTVAITSGTEAVTCRPWSWWPSTYSTEKRTRLAEETKGFIAAGHFDHIHIYQYNHFGFPDGVEPYESCMRTTDFLMVDTMQRQNAFFTRGWIQNGTSYERSGKWFKSDWHGPPDGIGNAVTREGVLEWVQFSWGGTMSLLQGYPLRHLKLLRLPDTPEGYIGYLALQGYASKPISKLKRLNPATHRGDWANRLIHFLMAPRMIEEDFLQVAGIYEAT